MLAGARNASLSAVSLMWFRPCLHKITKGAGFLMVRFSFLASISLALMLTAFPANASQQEKVIYGAWSYECKSQIGSEKNLCVASQLVGDKKTKQTVLGVMVGFLPEHPMPHIIFRLSPKANLEKGAVVKVDQKNSFKVPIYDCDEKICEVRSFIPEELLLQMRMGKELLFVFFLDQKQMTYFVSLIGFEETYAALKSNLK